MASRFNLNARLEIESLEDRVMATTGVNLAPVLTSQPVSAVVQTSPMLIFGLESHGSIGNHLDTKCGLRTNHNETLGCDGAKKRRPRS